MKIEHIQALVNVVFFLLTTRLYMKILLKFKKKISAPTPSALTTYTRVGPTGINLVHVYFSYPLIKMDNKM